MKQKIGFTKRQFYKYRRVIFVGTLCLTALTLVLCGFMLWRIHTMEEQIEILSKGYNSETNIEHYENMLFNRFYDRASKTMQKFDEHISNIQKDMLHGEKLDMLNAVNAEAKKEVFSNGKRVYLTFDDGPGIYTDELLDVLKEKKVKATFFCIYNSNESVWPAYKRIVDEGHTIAMHSYTHVYDDIYADLEAYKNDVQSIRDFIYEQTGVECKYYRFPGGSSNTVSKVDMQEMIAYLDSEGIVYYDWNSMSGDAADASISPTKLNENVLEYVRNNSGDSIVLMHDLQSNHNTIEGLGELIDTLKTEGYEICAIDDDTPLIQHVKLENDESE